MAAETERTAKRRRIRLWHVPVAMFVVLVVAMLGMRWHWWRGCRQRVAAVAAAGYPVKFEDLAAWYPAPTSGENGAQALLDAASGHVDRLTSAESRRVRELFAVTRHDAIKEEDRAALKRLVADNQGVLAGLHAAARFGHCHYEIDWAKVSGWRIEPVERIGAAAPLLAYAVLLATEEGRADDAVDAIVTLSVIDGSLAEIPMLGAHSGSTYWRDISIGYLERGMGRWVLTDDQLQRLQAALGTEVGPQMFEHALAGHMCMVLRDFMEPASRASDAFLMPAPLVRVYDGLGLTAREARFVVEAMASYIAVTRRPLREWQSGANAVDAAFEEEFSGCLLVNAGGGFKLSHIPMGYLRRTARLRAARGAMAVERYRLARGALPSSLGDLVPAYLDIVPEDPFTGRPLRYEKLGKGLVVYSVGPDGRDDGGWEEPPYARRKGGQYDLTFTVER